MVAPVSQERLPPDEPAQRMQRVRVGVTGLAAVLIVVAVATAIASGVRRSAETVNAVAPPSVAATVTPLANTTEPASEPLAQLGAAPGSNPEAASKAAKK